MEAGPLGRLLLQYSLLRGGVTVAIAWGVGALVGIGTAMIGLVVVLVGGVIAGISLFSAPRTGPANLNPVAVPFVQTLDPLAHSGDPPGSKTTRRFFYGIGLLVFGGSLLVLGG